MADLNHTGSITAYCNGCNGGKSTFEWQISGKELGALQRPERDELQKNAMASFRLFRCAGCGVGAFAKVIYTPPSAAYPGSERRLSYFFPESEGRLDLPKDVPAGIATEFREAETCLGNNCVRAAAGMFRSVLDKTLRANGYKTAKENLYNQIEHASQDGVITSSRKLRAHDEIRVLGNDVLHDDWHKIEKVDVEACRHYCQRILEDFYDDRASVLSLLKTAGRIPNEDKSKTEDAATVPPK